MCRIISLCAWLLLVVPVSAQQQLQVDMDTMQKAAAVLQNQRNAAMDSAANAEVKAARLADENARLKAEIEAMKKKNE